MRFLLRAKQRVINISNCTAFEIMPNADVCSLFGLDNSPALPVNYALVGLFPLPVGAYGSADHNRRSPLAYFYTIETAEAALGMILEEWQNLITNDVVYAVATLSSIIPSEAVNCLVDHKALTRVVNVAALEDKDKPAGAGERELRSINLPTGMDEQAGQDSTDEDQHDELGRAVPISPWGGPRSPASPMEWLARLPRGSLNTEVRGAVFPNDEVMASDEPGMMAPEGMTGPDTGIHNTVDEDAAIVLLNNLPDNPDGSPMSLSQLMAAFSARYNAEIPPGLLRQMVSRQEEQLENLADVVDNMNVNVVPSLGVMTGGATNTIEGQDQEEGLSLEEGPALGSSPPCESTTQPSLPERRQSAPAELPTGDGTENSGMLAETAETAETPQVPRARSIRPRGMLNALRRQQEGNQ